jgi:hypothetical protein
MALFEEHTHAFIVRIWLEPREDDNTRTGADSDSNSTPKTTSSEWRGVIEHVTTHEKRFLRDLDAITAFIRVYLERMGADLGTRWWEDVGTVIDTGMISTGIETETNTGMGSVSNDENDL